MTEATQSLLPVTQADRDAALPFIATDFRRGDTFSTGYYVRRGERDDHALVQAFARHRISHPLPGDVGMREALEVGERFLNACNSAWAAGEPSHRVVTMLNLADEFRSKLDAALTPSAPKEGFDREWCVNMAKKEAGYAIGAGELAIDPFTPSALSGDAGEGEASHG